MKERKPFAPPSSSDGIVRSLGLKEHKEEKDGKEDKFGKESKRAKESTRSKEESKPEPYISYKPFRSTDHHQHIMSFLAPDAIKWRRVNKEWKARNEIFYWQECQKKLPANLDKRAHIFLRLMCARDKTKFVEVVSFMHACYKKFKLPETINVAVEAEVEAEAEVKVAVEEVSPVFPANLGLHDNHFELFTAIVGSDVKKVIQITSIPDFNVNYLIGYLSPLMIAKLFPQDDILRKLKELGAQLLSSQVKLLVLDRSKQHLPRDKVYFLVGLEAIKSSSIIVEIIKTELALANSGVIESIIYYGITLNKPVGKLVLDTLSAKDEPSMDQLFSACFNENIDDSRFGKNSADVITILLDHPAVAGYLHVSAHRLWLKAAKISVHMLKPFLDFDPNCLKSVFPGNLAPGELTVEDLADVVNLDCVGELVRQFPDNESLRRKIVEKIIKNIRRDSDGFEKLDFTSYEERYESIIHTLNYLVRNHPEEFAQSCFFSRAIECCCHEFLQALDRKMVVPSASADLHLGGDARDSYLFYAVFWSLSSDFRLTIQTLLEFERLDVNARDQHEMTALHALIKCITSENFLSSEPFQIEYRLKAAEVLIAHPRVSLDVERREPGWKAWHDLCQLPDKNIVKRLFSCVKSRGHLVGDMLSELATTWNGEIILETLLPAIERGSDPDLLAQLFVKNQKYSPSISILLQRSDLVLPAESKFGEMSLPDYICNFARFSQNDLFRLGIIHPGLDMMEFRNKKIFNKERYSFSLSYDADYFNEKTLMIMRSRRSVDKAETALMNGKLGAANTNFNKARKRDGELLDIYVQQVMEKFPDNYRYTSAQREQLYSCSAVLQSGNASTSLLLAKHHSADNPALAEVLCDRALRLAKITPQEKIAIEAQMKAIANRPEKEYKRDPKECLLALATKATEKVMGVFHSPHEALANRIINMFEHKHEKLLEKQFLLNECGYLITQGVKINDPFFAALLTMIEGVRILTPKLECKAEASQNSVNTIQRR